MQPHMRLCILNRMSKDAKQVATTAEENLAKLTPKQQLYLENRIQGLSVKAAAGAAGYMADSSRVYKDLENHPRIKYLLHEATKQAFQKITVTRSDVIAGFMDAVNAAQSSTELVMAWRELGKIIGAYEPEVKIIKHVDITAEKIRNMKDADLLEMAEMESYLLPDVEEDVIEAEYVEIDDISPEHVEETSDLMHDDADMEADTHG